MAQFSWETEVMEQEQPQTEPDMQVEPQPEPEPAQEAAVDAAAQPAEALAVSADDFLALEERILRAVNLVKRERLARAEAEERMGKAEKLLTEQTLRVAQMQTELNTLRSERDHVRQRVEGLLTQLDALEL